MGNVLPEPPGLDINGVIYSYTIQKEVGDSVDVHVQNDNPLGSGYIIRKPDSWEPGSLGGTQINKNVPVIPGIPRAAWGDGSIVTEGDGSVSDATVIYTYKVDPCYNPQYDPNCPGYKVPVPDIPEVDLASLYDTVSDENVTLDRNIDGELIDDEDKDKKSEEELAEEEAEEKEDRENRLEKALSAVDNSELFAQSFAAAKILESINASTNMNTYYAARISGGTYTDTIVLQDKQLPDSNNGLRNGLAQQLLHEQMIDEQYNK